MRLPMYGRSDCKLFCDVDDDAAAAAVTSVVLFLVGGLSIEQYSLTARTAKMRRHGGCEE